MRSRGLPWRYELSPTPKLREHALSAPVAELEADLNEARQSLGAMEQTKTWR